MNKEIQKLLLELRHLNDDLKSLSDEDNLNSAIFRAGELYAGYDRVIDKISRLLHKEKVSDSEYYYVSSGGHGVADYHSAVKVPVCGYDD